MAALFSLPPPQLLHLSHSLSSDILRRHVRLSTLLSSPTLFSLALRYLLSLPLPAKSLLLSRHLLSYLRHLTRLLPPAASAATVPPLQHSTLPLRDHDAASLLLLLCDLRHQHPDALDAPPSQWRLILLRYFSDAVLSVSGIGVPAFIPCVEAAARCRGLLLSMGSGCACGFSGERAASPSAVAALPSVEVVGGGAECAICREEMREGRDVCQLPCQHRFHWICILPWVRKRDTCPCCRFRLPTDDWCGEIQRLWEFLLKTGGGVIGGDDRR